MELVQSSQWLPTSVVPATIGTVVPGDEERLPAAGRGRHPLLSAARVAVDPRRHAPGQTVVGRADDVDVAAVGARTVDGVRVDDRVVVAGGEVAPAHEAPDRIHD